MRTFEGPIRGRLQGLAAEARKCKTYAEFDKAFGLQLKHGRYYHLTEDPNFHIDPLKGPRDLSSMSSGTRMNIGKFMITSHLAYWIEEFERTRPYVAVIDMSDVPHQRAPRSRRLSTPSKRMKEEERAGRR